MLEIDKMITAKKFLQRIKYSISAIYNSTIGCIYSIFKSKPSFSTWNNLAIVADSLI